MDRQQLFMIFIIMMIFFNVQNTKDEVGETKERIILQKYKDSLEEGKKELLHSSYDTGYGNLTGFKLSYLDSIDNRNILHWPFREYSPKNPWQEKEGDSILPNTVSNSVKLFWGTSPVNGEESAYLLNISGNAYGEFLVTKPKAPIRPIPLPLPEYLKEYYSYYRQEKYDEEKQRYEEDPERNSPPQEIVDDETKIGNITTYSHGPMELRIQNLESAYPELNIDKLGLGLVEDAVLVRLSLTLKDRTEADVNEFEMFGIYFQNTGSLVGITKSAKFMGNHALPHFTMNAQNFNKTKTLMSRLLNVTNIQNDVMLDDVTASVQQSQQLCELVSYFQFARTDFSKHELRAIDDELVLPQGVPLPKRLPELKISDSLLYSPDCGLIFENNKTEDFMGKRSEVLIGQFRKILIGLLVLVLLEINLFVRLTKHCQTPSHLSNVSTFGITILGSYDLMMGTILVFFMRFSELFLLCSCTVVLYGLLTYVLQIRYVLTIDSAQANERATTWWEILRGGGSGNADLEAQTTGTQTTGTTQVAPQPETQPQLPEEPTNVLGYFILSFVIAFGTTYLVFSAMTWRVSVRRVFEYVFVLGMNSYWVPQFLRNTLKNRRRTLLWEFVFGLSLVRVIPVIYICMNPGNPFRHAYDPVLVLALAGWLLGQILLLYLQSVLGARFWVNDRWLPEQHNYHPVLTLKELENGFALDVISSLKPGDGALASMCEMDCAICMSTLTFPVVGDAKEGKSYEKMMKATMVTPCHHIFHTTCLEDWMSYKLQCPVCRSALPPL